MIVTHRTYKHQRRRLLVVLTSTTIALASPLGNMAWAAPPIDFCANRTPDQQLGATAQPRQGASSAKDSGCQPLAEKRAPSSPEETEPSKESSTPPRALKLDHLPAEVAQFLGKYRDFLACCKTDLADLEQVEELGNEVGELLALAQSELFSEHVKLRGWTLRELILPVAKARQDLQELRSRLEDIARRHQHRDSLEGEEALRETHAIQEAQEAIEKDYRAPTLPGGARTGRDIGSSSSAGTTIGKTPTTGTTIGSSGLTGVQIGVTPKTGTDIGTMGPTGFAIGGTGRAGPDIGESGFNRYESSSVDSSLPSSTIGSSLQDSTVGSDLGTSTIGSTLGGSSSESSPEQNRSH